MFLCIAFTKIGLDHVRVLDDEPGVAFGDFPAVVQNDDPLTEVHDHFHHMLDQHDRHPKLEWIRRMVAVMPRSRWD